MFFDHRWKRRGDFQDILQVIKEREENAPQGLPQTRPRRLSVTAQGSHDPNPFYFWSLPRKLWNVNATVNPREGDDKNESTLILRLPPEIRQQIWQYALSGRLLHLTRAECKLLALECPYQCPQSMENTISSCWGLLNRNTRMFPGHYLMPHPDKTTLPTKLLALPQTCRLM